MPVEFSVVDPRSPGVVTILDRHLAFARLHTPPEDVHALDVDGLTAGGVTVFGLTVDGSLLAIGALRDVSEGHCEIKSMHTVEEARGRGLGRLMVRHLLEEARRRGAGRVSLETGRMQAFEAARRLYESLGFVECEPFGNYPGAPNSVCMTLYLDHAGEENSTR